MDVQLQFSRNAFRRTFHSVTAVLALTLGTAALAAESSDRDIRVMTRPDMVGVLTALAPQIEEFTGSRLVIDTMIDGAYSRRLSEPFDLAIVDGRTAETLNAQGKVASGGLSCIAWTGLGLAARRGVAISEIATVAGLRETLLAARSIAFSGDEWTGAQFRDVLAQLGIADKVEPKLIDTGNRHPLKVVQHGGADLTVALQSEIVTTPRVEALGPLPSEVQHMTPIFAAVSGEAVTSGPATRLAAFLASFDAVKALHAAGLDTSVTE